VWDLSSHTKEIKCSRCGCKRVVPINWQYKQCPKCKKRQEKKQAEEKTERKKRKEARQDEAWRIGALNEPDAEFEDFMSWEEYKALWEGITGHTPKFKEGYLKDKDKFMERQRRDRQQLEPTDTNSIIMNVPVDRYRREACLKNRRMWLGLIPRDAIDIQNHCSCRWCRVWKKYNKSHLMLGGIQGVDLWKSGIR